MKIQVKLELRCSCVCFVSVNNNVLNCLCMSL